VCARVYAIELDIGLDAAVDLLRLVREGRHGPPAVQLKNVTAWDLLNDSELQQPIVTFSEQLDQLLGGGIPLGKMTEFCGAPGIGKTQVWLVHFHDYQVSTTFQLQ
jgi:RAD51-like protein 2